MSAAAARVHGIMGYQYNDAGAVVSPNAFKVGGAQVAGADEIVTRAYDGVDPNYAIPPEDAAGVLIAGEWFFSEPRGGCADYAGAVRNNCPCAPGAGGADAAWQGACFLPNDAASDKATAFQVRLHTKSTGASNLIKRTFSAVMLDHATDQGMMISAEAFAALVPRHAAFVVDFSNSIAGETHPPATTADLMNASLPQSSKGQVAYSLMNASSCPAANGASFCPSSSGAFWDAFTNRMSHAYTSPFVYGDCSTGGWYHGMLDRRPSLSQDCTNRPHNTTAGACNPPNGTLLPEITVHYKDDYMLRGGESFAAACVTPIDPDLGEIGSYMVERPDTILLYPLPCGGCTAEEVLYQPRLTRPACGALSAVCRPQEYYGPQPLVRILDGIHEAAKTMESFAVRGDAIVFIGFDNEVLALRTISDASPGNESFATLLNLTNIRSRPAVEARNARAFFPRDDNSFTDISEALLTARDILANLPDAGIADTWVALFSDGIANCGHTDASGNFLHYDAAAKSLSFAGVDSCGSSNDYLAAGDEIRSLVLAGAEGVTPPLAVPPEYVGFAAKRIKLHTFLFGNYVQPHTLLRKNSNHCMSDAEARAEARSFTYDCTASDPFCQYGQTPNLASNQFYHSDLSTPTEGQYFPMRPPCDPTTLLPGSTDPQTDCRLGLFMEALNARCASAAVADKAPLDSGSDISGVLQNGRLICDPFCRTPNEQIKEAIQELFKDNPFILVAPASG